MANGAYVGELAMNDRTREDSPIHRCGPDNAAGIERYAFDHAVWLFESIIGIKHEKILSPLKIIEQTNGVFTFQLEIGAARVVQHFSHRRNPVTLPININQHGVGIKVGYVTGFQGFVAFVFLLEGNDASYLRSLFI